MSLGPVKTPKADNFFIINCSLLYQEENKGEKKKVPTKVHVSHISHKSLKWITEGVYELDLPICSI